MKTPKYPTGKRGGSALIIVLASLVFISALTIAFLMSMRSKLILSKSGSDANNVKMLAETAVNIAISQVRDATLKSGSNGMAWASQPGMVRLYNDSGNAAGYYKLYSADNMVADSGAFDPKAEALLLDNWASAPAVFTDLNAPANGVFPIVDYAAAASLGVQGFSLDTVPGATASQPVPMPVKWLYVLADGTLSTPDPSSTGTSVVIAAATSANPIVGRIAFWTDDETCKVNVNTASEGTFWSTPRFNTTSERAFANSQPARGEFQRYPGHPATVSLKSLFPTLTSQQIFSIAPRLSWGGSEGGAKPVQDVNTWITTDRDRLYDSMDEMLFSGTWTGTSRELQDGLTLPMVKASRFFLTANSRAPELNLYGLPRIATWPIHAVNDSNYRTVNDRLLAFCSTVGTSGTSYPFYFTREQNVDPWHDISLDRNTKLLDYLDRLTGQPIPGFGGTFQYKYTQPETRQILTEIFDYIRCTNLFDRTTPQSPAGYWPYAFGISSRLVKGTDDMGAGASLGTAAPAYRKDWETRGFGGRFLQIRAAHIHFVGLGDSSNPIDDLQTGTLDSRITDKSHVPTNTTAVQAYIYLSTLTPSEGIEFWSPGHWIEIMGLDKFGIKLKPTDSEYAKLQFPGDDEMTIVGNMMGGGGVGGARVANLEPYACTFAQNEIKVLTTGTIPDQRRRFPFYSAILPVDSTSPTMDFQGGTITIRIYADAPLQGYGPFKHGALIEELSLKFPDATFPTPLLASRRLVGSGNPDLANERWTHKNPGGYFEPDKDVLKSVPLDKGDIRLVVGPTVVTTGTTTTTPVTITTATSSFYAAESGYSDSTKRMVPTFSYMTLDRKGKLVANADYNQNPPFVPDHFNGVTTSEGAPGDWDNGTAIIGDGPFINAADPGSITPEASSGNLAYFDNSYHTASTSPNFFSPNRQMPGPGMFGSLSTGVQRNRPWQTLLFRPGPTNPANHPGMGTPAGGPPYTKPPDHLFLDLFWMPVVEPYAISEPFSTAGKINMNQQLVPFTYIDRMAALRAAFASEQVAVVGKGDANKYKLNGNPGASLETRKPLNLSEADGTLRQFKEKFDSGEIFRSATEICDIYMVPDGRSWKSDSAAQSAWYSDDFAMVGDNTRERPYAHMYNKLTTKSNSYTVHYHVQILQKPKARNDSDLLARSFDPSKGDKVVADQRGATTFERYLDPADPRIIEKTDPASSTAKSLEQYYRARIINASIFNP